MADSLKKIAVDLIVFDLDGTLADSLPDLTTAANYACRKLGLPERSPQDVAGMIGGGERRFMERLAGPDHQELVDDCLAIYLDYYTAHAADLTRLYPGVPETLEKLTGKKLAVLSNKLQRLTERVLEALGIARFFNASRGGGSGLALKPSPEPLIALIRELKAQPDRAMMVGDKPADISAGRGAGTRVAVVTYGYGDLESLTAAAPDFFLSRFDQLADIID
ncbi:MAG: HAD-IA family hydrolase [Deltaproteobacteria bacterium]|nr:HAD-IA family hydrolase [Deltaproteobacteria bacterium]